MPTPLARSVTELRRQLKPLLQMVFGEYFQRRIEKLNQASLITKNGRQVPYTILAVNRVTQIAEPVGKYIADFVFLENGAEVVMDCKGGNATKTRDYKLKKAILAVQDDINIIEV